MGNLNKVFLIGRLGKDPEKRITPGAHSVLNTTLATSDFYKDKIGTRQEKTEWHRVVFWDRLAEIVERYCKKGSQIFVEGSLQTREWQDKDGNRRFTTEIVGRNIQLLDGKGSSGENRPTQTNEPDRYNLPKSNFPGSPLDNESKKTSQKDNDDFVEDDIPF